MTQTPLTSTEVIAERVRHLMARKGWTAQDLVDALQKVGINWTRLIVANLLVKKPERRRRYVTVDELFGLATVLDVAPIHLLLPIDRDGPDRYAYVPNRWVQLTVLYHWIRGSWPLSSQDERIYYSEVPPGTREEQRLREAALRWRERGGFPIIEDSSEEPDESAVEPFEGEIDGER